MNKDEYSEYLKSRHWLDISAEALRLANYRCQVCNSELFLNVHHRTYERLSNEYLTDLTVLCRECHELFHKSVEESIKIEDNARKARLYKVLCGVLLSYPKHMYDSDVYEHIIKYITKDSEL